MRKFFHTDQVSTGLVAGLAAVAGTCLAVLAFLLLTHRPPQEHLRLFGLAFIPLVFILHHYAKRKQMLVVTRTLIVILFVLFLAYMFVLFHTRSLTL